MLNSFQQDKDGVQLWWARADKANLLKGLCSLQTVRGDETQKGFR